ncbi:MAG: type II toxin-antitoxin system VapC family toxin [Ignavibacteriales bacterium]|nr:type II toxin-antitoxin system VapC family toxin [Ignavibacteriales bacterium]
MSHRPKVYIESTIPGYLTSRPSRDIVKLTRQRFTKIWWKDILPTVDPVISDFVLQEIRRGDPDAARRREAAITNFEVLDSSPLIEELAQLFIGKLKIPQKAHLDAYHLATSVVYQVDYVLSWNFDHIVGAPVKRTFAEIGKELDLLMPTLATPEDFLGGNI